MKKRLEMIMRLAGSICDLSVPAAYAFTAVFTVLSASMIVVMLTWPDVPWKWLHAFADSGAWFWCMIWSGLASLAAPVVGIVSAWVGERANDKWWDLELEESKRELGL